MTHARLFVYATGIVLTVPTTIYAAVRDWPTRRLFVVGLVLGLLYTLLVLVPVLILEQREGGSHNGSK